MKKSIFILFFCLISFIGFSQQNNPVSWEIYAEKIESLTYKITLAATIKSPYHIYPTGGNGGGLGMPTEISFADNPDVQFLGSVEEKGNEDVKKSAYYKDSASFSWVVKLASDNPQTLSLTVKYMACNDRMCLPPAKKILSLTVNGKDLSNQQNILTEIAGVSSKMESDIYHVFTLPDEKGKLVSSSDIVKNNKYVFIDFWASWCSPCRLQGKDLLTLYKYFQTKGLHVIGISLDTDVNKWKAAIKADGYTWTNLSDLKGFDSPLVKSYHISAIPRNFLVDKEGRIVGKDLHGRELQEKFIELMGN